MSDEIGEHRAGAPGRPDRVAGYDGGLAQRPVGEQAARREVKCLVLAQREGVERVAAVARYERCGPLVVFVRVALGRLGRSHQCAQARRGGAQAEHQQEIEGDRDRLTGSEPPGAMAERRGSLGERRRQAASRYEERARIERVRRCDGCHRDGPGQHAGAGRPPSLEGAAACGEQRGERERERALLVVEALQQVDERDRDEQHAPRRSRRAAGHAAFPS